MNRLPRILLNAATAILLLLSAGALVLGTWTHRQPEEVTARFWTVAADRADRVEWLVWCGRGRVIVDRARHSWWGSQLGEARKVAEDDGPVTWTMGDDGPWPIDEDIATWLPIRMDTIDLRSNTSTANHRSASVSCSFLALVSGAWPLAALAAFVHGRRRGARAAGRCRHCGYDLRATPARCPECGTIPAR